MNVDHDRLQLLSQPLKEWIQHDLMKQDCCTPISDETDDKLSQKGNILFRRFYKINSTSRNIKYRSNKHQFCWLVMFFTQFFL
jgi:predicted ATP-grasp superfamily ATP-dependent carboligase